MTLVAGSYERFLFGFEYADLGEDGASLKKRFSMPAHQGPVKCVAARGSWIVTGGADDQLHIFAEQPQRTLVTNEMRVSVAHHALLLHCFKECQGPPKPFI